MKLLDGLGLREYDKGIILALVKNKILSASEISKLSKVPQNKVYQVIADMVKQGIVIENGDSPKKYCLNDFENFVKNKIAEKREDVDRLESEYEKFMTEYNQPVHSEEFWVLNNTNILLEKIEFAYENISSESVALIESWIARYSTLKKTRDKIREGVKVRFLGSIGTEDVDIVKKWLEVGVEIRKIDEFSGAGFSVFDDKYVKFSIVGTGLNSIWSENSSLALMTKNYFNLLWEKGIEINLDNIDQLKE